MKAIDLVGNIGTECRGTDVNKEVSLLTLWSIRNKFTKILEDGKDSPLEIKKLDQFLNGILEEQNMRKKARVEFDTNDSSGMSGTQVEESQPDVLVSDHIVRVKTKGRPKVATRIKSGMEASMNSKKQKACSYCRGTGHYITRCPKKGACKS
ncbi:FAR1-related sequence 5-like protein [Tanacetum coccineum]|uniref:FAR1-related sequence 5-like protein n=1 Tax=Tanacetum coccineum TaxID=301880 RepID=A0ABQ4ZIH0_9ASTR